MGFPTRPALPAAQPLLALPLARLPGVNQVHQADNQSDEEDRSQHSPKSSVPPASALPSRGTAPRFAIVARHAATVARRWTRPRTFAREEIRLSARGGEKIKPATANHQCARREPGSAWSQCALKREGVSHSLGRQSRSQPAPPLPMLRNGSSGAGCSLRSFQFYAHPLGRCQPHRPWRCG